MLKFGLIARLQKILNPTLLNKNKVISKKVIMETQILLKSIFRSAVQQGYLDKNPMKWMKEMIKESSRKFIPWSHDKIYHLLETAYLEGEGLMYEFEHSTGLRLGELLALSWRILHGQLLIK
jgi:integrase